MNKFDFLLAQQKTQKQLKADLDAKSYEIQETEKEKIRIAKLFREQKEKLEKQQSEFDEIRVMLEVTETQVFDSQAAINQHVRDKSRK